MDRVQGGSTYSGGVVRRMRGRGGLLLRTHEEEEVLL